MGKTQRPKAAAAEGSLPQRGRKISVHPDKESLVPYPLKKIKKASSTVPPSTTNFADYVKALLPGGPCLTAAQQRNLPDLNEFTTAGRRTASPHEELLITACATCDAHHGHNQDDPIDLSHHDEISSRENPIDLSQYEGHDARATIDVDCYLCTNGWATNHEESKSDPNRLDPRPSVATWAQDQRDQGQLSCLQEEALRKADQQLAFFNTEQWWAS